MLFPGSQAPFGDLKGTAFFKGLGASQAPEIAKSWGITHSVNVHDQLIQGSRYLDMRVHVDSVHQEFYTLTSLLKLTTNTPYRNHYVLINNKIFIKYIYMERVIFRYISQTF